MWQEWLFYSVSPFTVALELWLAAIVCLSLAHRKAALALSVLGFVGLWLGSTPFVANSLVGLLERDYPALTAQATPSADAILVLGGAIGAARPPYRPNLSLTSSSTRVLHAAELYHAGKARWVVVAAGNRPEAADFQVEADAIAQFLQELGVPASAIRLERQSRNTRENAALVEPLLRTLGAKKVLLVTSAMHMPRAMRTFSVVWKSRDIELIPAVTDLRTMHGPITQPRMWLPSLDALVSVTGALKEFAGMVALAIIRDTA